MGLTLSLSLSLALARYCTMHRSRQAESRFRRTSRLKRMPCNANCVAYCIEVGRAVLRSVAAAQHGIGHEPLATQHVCSETRLHRRKPCTTQSLFTRASPFSVAGYDAPDAVTRVASSSTHARAHARKTDRCESLPHTSSHDHRRGLPC